jgi:nucleoside-diphosphate-sugar epimerase
MRVLITGAAGFIGSHLVEDQLERGREVVAVDLVPGFLPPFAGRPGFSFHQVDVVEASHLRSLMDGVDVIFHLAAVQNEIEAEDDRYREVNVRAVRALLENAQSMGVRRVVHCGSTGVYGDVKVIPANEETAPSPTNIYEHTKLEGERAALDFYRETGFSVVVLRPSWVYGPRCRRTEKLLRGVSKGRFPLVGDGNNYRHPVFIQDLVEAFNAAAETPGVDGQVFLIAGDRYLRLNELLGVVSGVTSGKVLRWKIPVKPVARAAAAVETLFRPFHSRPPLSRRSTIFFTHNNAFDIAKARSRLGFSPSVGLEEGLKETWQKLSEAAEAEVAGDTAPAILHLK